MLQNTHIMSEKKNQVSRPNSFQDIPQNVFVLDSRVSFQVKSLPEISERKSAVDIHDNYIKLFVFDRG
jgi:hypothetical protein